MFNWIKCFFLARNSPSSLKFNRKARYCLSISNNDYNIGRKFTYSCKEHRNIALFCLHLGEKFIHMMFYDTIHYRIDPSSKKIPLSSYKTCTKRLETFIITWSPYFDGSPDILSPLDELEIVLFIRFRLNWTPSISCSIIFIFDSWFMDDVLLPNPGLEIVLPRVEWSEVKRVKRWFVLGCWKSGFSLSDEFGGWIEPTLIRCCTWLFAVSSRPKSSIKSLMTRTSNTNIETFKGNQKSLKKVCGQQKQKQI